MKGIDQANVLLTKRNFIPFLLIILITVITSSLYLLKIQFVSPLFYITSKNQSVSTKLILQNQTRNCIVYMNDRGGRLGNRMFMIASAYGLARLHFCHLYLTREVISEMKTTFVLDLSPLLISSSTFNSMVNHASEPMKTVMRNVVCQYIVELTRPNAISQGTIFEMQGYWQSYLHFARYGDELRERIFVAKQTVLEKVSTFFIDLYQQNFGFKPQFFLENHQSFKRQLSQSNRSTWIGVHIRRTDFVQLRFSSSDQYIFAAMRYYTSHYLNAHFIVASDDKSYCKKLFRGRSNIFITPQSFSIGDDLITLSLCQHSIITGGTFGWWSGYLANGQVVHDKIYPSGCERRAYYYPPWFLIDGNVRANKKSDYVLK
jgi:hypothetical protein